MPRLSSSANQESEASMTDAPTADLLPATAAVHPINLE